jgi:hypothetical protein
MTKREWIDQYAEHNGMPMLVMDEFDEAIVGICHRVNDSFVLYDRAKIIEILTAQMTDDGEEGDDPEEAAWDHFGFNVIGSWVGENTPGFLELPD